MPILQSFFFVKIKEEWARLELEKLIYGGEWARQLLKGGGGMDRDADPGWVAVELLEPWGKEGGRVLGTNDLWGWEGVSPRGSLDMGFRSPTKRFTISITACVIIDQDSGVVAPTE